MAYCCGVTSSAPQQTIVAGRLLDVGRASATNETVRRTVKALGSFYAINATDLARAVGVSRATWFTRTSGKTDFSIGETAVLADLFGCTVEDLTTGRVAVSVADPAPAATGTDSATRINRGCSSSPRHLALVPATAA